MQAAPLPRCPESHWDALNLACYQLCQANASISQMRRCSSEGPSDLLRILGVETCTAWGSDPGLCDSQPAPLFCSPLLLFSFHYGKGQQGGKGRGGWVEKEICQNCLLNSSRLMPVPTNTLTQPHTPMGAHLPGCTSTQGHTRVSVQKFPVLTVLRMKRMSVCVLGVGGFGLAGSLGGLSARVPTQEMLHRGRAPP